MNIRPAHVDDAGAIASVHVRTWQRAYRGIVPDGYLDSLSVERREISWREALARATSEVWVAEAAAGPVGWIAFGGCRDADASADTGEVEALYVLPDYWSTGTGRELWLRARSRLRERGFGRVTLWVLSDNARAVRFYVAAGFAAAMQRNIEIGGAVLAEIRYELPIL